MKQFKYCIMLLFALIGSHYLYAQQSDISPAALIKKALQQKEKFAVTNMIVPGTESATLKNKLASSLSAFSTFTLNKTALQPILKGGDMYMQLNLPLPDGGTMLLQLARVKITTDDFTVTTPGGVSSSETGVHYRGIADNDENSIVAISIFDHELSGMVSVPGKGDYTIGLMRDKEDMTAGKHIIYNTKEFKGKKPVINCEVKDDLTLPYSAKQLSTDVNEAIVKYARLYYETEFDMFTTLGSVTAVGNFVIGMHNQVATLYANAGVNVLASTILVWNANDPYNGGSSSANLAAFQSVRTSFNGDLGQLLTFRSIGGGIAAGFNGLCNPSVAARLSTSGIFSFYNNFPTYSWTVFVVTHEFGHLFGSRHTHACVWNGNNTAIDGCSGFTEGGCALPGIPSGGGTIMSYCHLQGVGVNFSLGFGPQPSSVIRNSVAAAGCLTSNCTLGSSPAWINCYARTACGWSTFDTYPRKMGDVNGDGRDDIIGFGGAGVYYSLSTGSSFGAPVFALANYATGAGGWANYNTYPREVADVNGDGRADIIGFGGAGVYVSYSTGAGFTAPSFVLATFGTAAGGWSSFDTYPRRMGDVNGDGRADIIGFGQAGVYVSYSTGSGFTSPSFVLATFGQGAGGWINQNTYPREIGDVNGDGRADIIGFGQAGVYVSYSTGSGFTAPSFVLATFGQFAGGWSSNNTYPRTVADVNGDGRADIVGFGAAGVYIALSTGSGFGSPYFWVANFAVSAGGWVDFNTYPRLLADANNDGRNDIIGFGNAATYVALSFCTASALPAGASEMVNAADIVKVATMPENIAKAGNTTQGSYTLTTGNLNDKPATVTAQENKAAITVYPNPAKNKIVITNSNADVQVNRLEIINTAGQIVVRQNVQNRLLNYTLELPQLKPGLYLIQFYNSKGEKMDIQKLVIE